MAKRKMIHPATCSVTGCERPYLARGYCNLHYHRVNVGNDVGPPHAKRQRNRKCSVAGCDRKHVANGYCAMHRLRVLKNGEPGPPTTLIGLGDGCLTAQGYRLIRRAGHPNANKNGYLTEHKFVMSKKLGRPLMKGETVHHKNGIRTDNRPDNLELWTSAQPSGQRVEDLISFAVELLTKYAADRTVWPRKHRTTRTHFLRS